MPRTIIDIYALQTVPPSNLNRDDTGSPKSAVYGGVKRARVSSQAWKRVTRERFHSSLEPQLHGLRTKRVLEVLRDRIVGRGDDIEQARAEDLARAVFTALGIKLTAPRTKKGEDEKLEESGYLVFLSNGQLDALAALAAEERESEDADKSLAARKKELKAIAGSTHSVDIALFGRMVADSTDLNVDAAAQVAHALSVHRVDFDADYFTAVDDVKNNEEGSEDAGAAMIGTVEFNSSTLYRYANVDVDRLNENLGAEDVTVVAVREFVDAFARSIPGGKQNTFAHGTLPELFLVCLRDTQPVNLVGAFERAVSGDHVAQAAAALARQATEIDRAYATTPVASWIVRVGEGTAAAAELGVAVSLPELIEQLGEAVAARLEA